MKFSHGSKFDSRKPAAARFVAIASSCTDLRTIDSLSLSLSPCFFLRVRHVGWGNIDSSKALIFNRIFARKTLLSSKVKVRRSSSFVSRLIDRCSISKKKKGNILSRISNLRRNVGEIRTARQQLRPIVVHSERDGSGEWKNAIQRLKSKVEKAREREKVGDVLVIWVANSCAIRRYQRMNERKKGGKGNRWRPRRFFELTITAGRQVV